MTSSLLNPQDRVIPEWELCDRIARALRRVPMKQGEMAHILGVRPETISRWMNGKTRPSHAWMMVLADMTGVDLAWLEHGHVDELRARRDSNPKPSDPESGGTRGRRVLVLVHSVPFVQDSVKRGFTVKLRSVS